MKFLKFQMDPQIKKIVQNEHQEGMLQQKNGQLLNFFPSEKINRFSV